MVRRRSLVLAAAFIALFAAIAPSPAQAQVSRGPYLQNGSSTAVSVRWRTSIAGDSRVRYGTTLGNLTSVIDDATATTEHEIRLTGLAPDTRYYYAVGTTTSTQAGDDANHFFVTAPAPGTTKATRIWILGDAGTGDSNQAQVRDAYYAFTGARHTDLWLMLGDNAYNTSTDAEMQRNLFNVYPTMLRKSVFFATRGNHESATGAGGVPHHYLALTNPTSGEAGGTPSGTEAYYSFDYANVHFVCLDSFGSNRASNGAMANWLRGDLAANTRTWTVAFWHHPPYTKGSHDSDTESQLIEMRQNILPILEQEGVDLVLAGHSHSYERSFLIDGHYGLSSTFTSAMKLDAGDGREGGSGAYQKPSLTPVAHQGAVYVVAGSSGQTGGGSLDHPAMFVSLDELGSLVLDVDGARLDARFLRETGAIVDSFTMLKATDATPSAPTGLVATAGDRQITLTWNAAANASSYNVKRSTTAGGPYAVRTTGLLGRNYTDTELDNGTTYHYVVSGVNAEGIEGPDSSPASATPRLSPPGPTTFVARDTTWRYLDDGSNQGAAWRATSFTDSGWKLGAAELGYGDGDETTVVSYGRRASSKYVTTYFRQSFTVTGATGYTTLSISLCRDDGAVVYINGTEALRTNMPTGTIGYRTLAGGNTGNETTFYTFTAPASLLREGVNVVAVEVHQNDRSSSDLSFNMDLIGNR
ncbi:MAG TPA: metallophosphoesterase [Polyangia bacterium]